MSKTSNSTYVLKPFEAGTILLRSLQRFYSEKKFLDISITCNGELLFGCHKLVLASCSSYFENLLSGTDGSAILNLDAVDSDYVQHLRTIVDFMYGQNVEISKRGSSFENLYEAARIFGVTALIKTLDAQLSSISSTSNRSRKTKHPIPYIDDDLEGPDRLCIDIPDSSTNQSEMETDLIEVRPCGIGSMLLVNFRRIKHEKKFIDAKICCQDRILFLCHKLVLASFSDYFETLLASTEGSAVLNLDAVDSLYVKQLSTIISYMYGDTTYVKAENMDLLQDAAHVFGVKALESGGLAKLGKNKRIKAGGDGSKKKELVKESEERDGIPINGNHSEAIIHLTNSSMSIIASNSTSTDTHTTEGESNVISQGRWPDEPSVQPDHLYSDATVTTSNGIPLVTDAITFSLCHGCGKTFRSDDPTFRSHVLEHETKRGSASILNTNKYRPLNCAECSSKFRNLSSLRSHWEMNHGTTQVNRGCFTCGLVCSSKIELQKHYGTEHGMDTLPSAIDVDASDSETTSANTFLCKVCGYKTTSLTDYVDHVNDKHMTNNVTCHLCSAAFVDRQTLNEHYENEHDVTLHKCDVCKKGFKTSAGYEYHMESHHGPTHHCSTCSFTTATKKNLDLHMKKYHPKTRSNKEIDNGGTTTGLEHLPHRCTECSMTFLYECLLTRHYHKKHLKLKPFQCPFCGHSTTERGALQTHIRCIHTNEMPFSCDSCGFKCKTSSILSRHRRTHTGEKPHVCVCGASFVDKRGLQAHHWKIHEKRRPFKCSECNVGFFRKDNLVHHLRSKH